MPIFGRLSEEQKKDYKLKITLGTIALVFAAPILLLGPLLPSVLDYVHENAKEPWAPEWQYKIGRIMEGTWREEQAMAVYQDLYIKYAGDEADEDFDEVVHHGGNGEYYMPYVVRTEYLDKDKDRPKTISAPKDAKAKEAVSWALVRTATYLEQNKAYGRSDHIWACVFLFWKEGSEISNEGKDAQLRRKSRSF